MISIPYKLEYPGSYWNVAMLANYSNLKIDEVLQMRRKDDAFKRQKWTSIYLNLRYMEASWKSSSVDGWPTLWVDFK